MLVGTTCRSPAWRRLCKSVATEVTPSPGLDALVEDLVSSDNDLAENNAPENVPVNVQRENVRPVNAESQNVAPENVQRVNVAPEIVAPANVELNGEPAKKKRKTLMYQNCTFNITNNVTFSCGL